MRDGNVSVVPECLTKTISMFERWLGESAKEVQEMQQALSVLSAGISRTDHSEVCKFPVADQTLPLMIYTDNDLPPPPVF
jgi:hypothetical protein